MPKQVLFKSDYSDGVQAGIQEDNGNIICACCGGVFEAEETTILREFDYWANFSECIGEPDLIEYRKHDTP